jgi:hypothetical protein
MGTTEYSFGGVLVINNWDFSSSSTLWDKLILNRINMNKIFENNGVLMNQTEPN